MSLLFYSLTLGYSQAAANAAAAAAAASAAGGRLVNPSSIEESNPSPSIAVLGGSATDTGGDSRSISFSLFVEKAMQSVQ